MIIHHPNPLHESIGDGTAAEFETTGFHVGRDFV